MPNISKALSRRAFSFPLFLTLHFSLVFFSCSSEAPASLLVQPAALWQLTGSASGTPKIELSHLLISGSVQDNDGPEDFASIRLIHESRNLLWEFYAGDVHLEREAGGVAFSLPAAGFLSFPPSSGQALQGQGSGPASSALPAGTWLFEYSDLAGQTVATEFFVSPQRYEDIAALLELEPAEYWYFGLAGPLGAEAAALAAGPVPGTTQRVLVRRSPIAGGLIYSVEELSGELSGE